MEHGTPSPTHTNVLVEIYAQINHNFLLYKINTYNNNKVFLKKKKFGGVEGRGP